MNLYTKFKKDLGQVKSVIADSEILILNRKDFSFTQISPVNGFLKSLGDGISISYAYRLYLNMLDFYCASLPKDRRALIYLSDESLTLAALYLYIRLGDRIRGRPVYCPTGVAKVRSDSALVSGFFREFQESISHNPEGLLDLERATEFVFVLGNSKTMDQSHASAEAFARVNLGLIAIKDFAKVGNFDEREFLESKGIFPTVTLEGHGFFYKAS